MEYCETKFKEKKLSIGKDIGIKVVEIKDIGEAINYYFI